MSACSSSGWRNSNAKPPPARGRQPAGGAFSPGDSAAGCGHQSGSRLPQSKPGPIPRSPKTKLRGATSKLRGAASKLRGAASKLRGAASKLRGDASKLRGATSKLRGGASKLRGDASKASPPLPGAWISIFPRFHEFPCHTCAYSAIRLGQSGGVHFPSVTTPRTPAAGPLEFLTPAGLPAPGAHRPLPRLRHHRHPPRVGALVTTRSAGPASGAQPPTHSRECARADRLAH